MDALSWFGYLASATVALSMTMSSIVKFRWINLVGASGFCTYGILIEAWPVACLNGFIVAVDLYYLWGIYRRKETFEILEIPAGSDYLMRFLKFHSTDIQQFCPGFEYNPDTNTISYYILRDMHVAGVFLARKENNILTVHLDYVIPEYRDFKNGRYFYKKIRPVLEESGIHKIRAAEATKYNEAYFRKLGFEPDKDGIFELNLR